MKYHQMKISVFGKWEQILIFSTLNSFNPSILQFLNVLHINFYHLLNRINIISSIYSLRYDFQNPVSLSQYNRANLTVAFR